MADSDLGWKIFTWAWDRKEEAGQRLRNLFAWFRGDSTAAGEPKEKKPGILIIGAGGTGKSTLGKLLAGQYDWLLASLGDYDESLGIERYSLTDDPEVEIVVPPGQEHRREATWSDLHSDIGAGKFRGIILVSAYGFHSLGQISYKGHKLYEGNKARFIKDFLEDRRAEELTILGQLVPHLKVSHAKLWMLTLVTKQDLWWKQHSQVEDHYRRGEYATRLEDVQSHKGQQQFRHEVVLASLVISNFITGRGELLRSNVAGYDHQRQVASLRLLFETLDALKNWEAGP